MDSSDTIIRATKKWIKDVVIGLNFCPFAAKPMKKEAIHYEVVVETSMENCLMQVLQECIRLDKDDTLATTLIILPKGWESFDDFWDLYEVAERLLEAHMYEGKYQIATFHPDYIFADSQPDDPENYTNRSPFPMLHLLREAELSHAIDAYPDVEEIPTQNILTCQQKGLKYMQSLRASCFE